MKPTQAVNLVTATMIKATLPEFGVGDTVRVSVKVVEGTRERTQVFEGVVMRKRGGGINTNFTVRRIAAHGIGVERTFLLHSPRVEKIEVVRHGMVRRAQLYFLRGRTGKAARIKERRYRPGAETSKTRSVATLEVPVAADMEAPDDTDDEMPDDAEMMAADDIEGVTSEADDVAEDDTESVAADDTDDTDDTEVETIEVSAEENGDTPNRA